MTMWVTPYLSLIKKQTKEKPFLCKWNMACWDSSKLCHAKPRISGPGFNLHIVAKLDPIHPNFVVCLFAVICKQVAYEIHGQPSIEYSSG